LLLFVWQQVPGVRPKSTPAVSVFARHQGRVVRWDGVTALVPGDAIRLEVFSTDLLHLIVSSPDGTRLYEGAVVASEATVLPVSFTLDAARGPEPLDVVLSKGPLSDRELHAALKQGRTDASIWVIHLVVPKETKP
jgi:hypothetical protein